MNVLPSKMINPNGLHHKYQVKKEDGTDCDPDSEYFLLRLDPFQKDKAHYAASRIAALTYARRIISSNRLLAMEMIDRYTEMIIRESDFINAGFESVPYSKIKYRLKITATDRANVYGTGFELLYGEFNGEDRFAIQSKHIRIELNACSIDEAKNIAILIDDVYIPNI